MEERANVIDWDARPGEPVDPTKTPPTESSEKSATVKINYKDALKLLDDFASEKTYSCWIPSIQQEVSFREINAAQQKELLKSIVDSPFYRSKFITTTYEILKKNFVADEEVDFDQFDIIDKQLILLKTRMECFNSTYELTTEDNKTKSIDLSKLYSKAQKKLSNGHDGDVIDKDQISVSVSVPNVLTEYHLEKELHTNVDLLDVNNPGTLRSTLGDIFISEISKYITEISINGKVIDFGPLKFRTRIEVVERLPNTVIQKIVTYIDKTKEAIDSITIAKGVDKETDAETSDQIPMDGSFFAIK